MFKLLLTVFLGVCVGAVVADLLFGPDQPATPGADSQGQQWEPWRSWYASARRQSRRALAAITTWAVTAAQATDRGARRLARWTVATVQLGPDTLRSVRARRQATAQRNAAHARHVAHLEEAAPRHSPLPPPVAPPLHPPTSFEVGPPPGTMGAVAINGTAGPNGDGAATAGPNGARPQDLAAGAGAPAGAGAGAWPGAAPPDADRPARSAWTIPLDPTESRRPVLGPPMDAPTAAGPPVPASLRGQELVETSEIPVDAALAGTDAGPLGRPPWDALVRRPMPPEAPGPPTDGRRGRAGGRSRRGSRRDPLAWTPGGQRPPDPEWDDGVPGPLVVPVRVRARSAAVLLAMTTIFGVVTAAAIVVVVVMAVGALDRF